MQWLFIFFGLLSMQCAKSLSVALNKLCSAKSSDTKKLWSRFIPNPAPSTISYIQRIIQNFQIARSTNLAESDAATRSEWVRHRDWLIFVWFHLFFPHQITSAAPNSHAVGDENTRNLPPSSRSRGNIRNVHYVCYSLSVASNRQNLSLTHILHDYIIVRKFKIIVNIRLYFPST